MVLQNPGRTKTAGGGMEKVKNHWGLWYDNTAGGAGNGLYYGDTRVAMAGGDSDSVPVSRCQLHDE